MTLNKKENLTLAEKRAKLEKEKLTRRQALARFGFQAGAAAVAALTADDLLHKVGEELQRRSGDNKVVQQVAKELRGAGVAYADAGARCLHACGTARDNALQICQSEFGECTSNSLPNCLAILLDCNNTANSNYTACVNNCP